MFQFAKIKFQNRPSQRNKITSTLRPLQSLAALGLATVSHYLSVGS